MSVPCPLATAQIGCAGHCRTSTRKPGPRAGAAFWARAGSARRACPSGGPNNGQDHHPASSASGAHAGAGGPLVPDRAGCTPAILDSQTFQPVPMGFSPWAAGVAASSGREGMTGAATGHRQSRALLAPCPPHPSRPRLPLPDQAGRGRPMADRGRTGPRPTGADHGSHAPDARREAKPGATMHPHHATIAGPPWRGRCNTGSRGARITQRNPKKGVRGA